ncbi:MAG: hypothetical protein ACXAC5_01780 [Promethearchaeota archaeon]|jgi:hypothetical protein
MPRFTKPEFFYHLTDKKWGARITLRPKTTGPYRVVEEPKTSRICVGKTIYGCFSAISCCLTKRKPVYIYRTYRRAKAAYVWRVADVSITQERWLLKPTAFMHIGTIPAAVIRKIKEHPEYDIFCTADPDQLNMQKKVLSEVIIPILKPIVEAL